MAYLGSRLVGVRGMEKIYSDGSYRGGISVQKSIGKSSICCKFRWFLSDFPGSPGSPKKRLTNKRLRTSFGYPGILEAVLY